MMPLVLTATETGPLNLALAPMPSTLPVMPEAPATVVTIPVGVTLRIASLRLSATRILPALSKARAVG